MHGNVPGSTAARKARAVIDRPPAVTGWLTSDEDEIERRRWRGRTEIAAVEPLSPRRSPAGGAQRGQIGPRDRALLPAAPLQVGIHWIAGLEVHREEILEHDAPDGAMPSGPIALPGSSIDVSPLGSHTGVR